jgi:hypothetical protein
VIKALARPGIYATSFDRSLAELTVQYDATTVSVADMLEVVTTLGYTGSEVEGRTSLELGLWRNPADRAQLARALATQGPLPDTLVEMVAKDGRPVPLMIAALNLLWGVRPQPREVAGILIGLFGVLLLTQGAGFQASPAGLIAIALACLTWCGGSVLAAPPVQVGSQAPAWQQGLPLAPGASGYASEMVCGGAVLMGMSLLAGESPRWPPDAVSVAAWCYLVVFGSLIAFNAYMLLLAQASSGLASSYTFVNPVIGLVLGVTLGGEVVTSGEWLAAGVVCAGVVLLLIKPRG